MSAERKKAIRRMILEHRDGVDRKIREQWDIQIFNQLVRAPFYRDASMVFTFVSFGSEVDTHRLIHRALIDGKRVCVPKIPSKAEGIKVYEISGFEDLREGYYGILEPIEGCREVAPGEIDFIIMPGLAFDQQGNRIGYGAGFYDRFLMKISEGVLKIALAYDLQFLDRVPAEEFDIKIDGIITNTQMIAF